MSSAEWKRGAPSLALAPFVDAYLGYRLTGFPSGLHRGLPSRNMTFIVSIGPPIDVIAQTNPTNAPGSYNAVVAGLHASPATISHQGHQEGVAVMLSPLGARSLLGMPPVALWDTTTELSEVIGRPGDELWERLQHAHGWSDRFAVLDTMLSGFMEDTYRIPDELIYAWDRLVRSSGSEQVSTVATEVGWSRQHLTRRFQTEFGLSPKLASRVFRFNRAIKMIESTPPFVSLAEIAIACGYYDQAHMTNEFVELGGAPPGKIFEGEVTYLQDTGSGSDT